ncbi:MAG: LacI family transcriptional regulator [Armatimonadetes bacterium]|nr:LacI family transcriptional regulator [Armatimonadota bacterium]
MRDVAERAGVSIKTVSRVVNDQGEISESTRQKVLQAIKETGYRPNTLARSLVSGKTMSVALLLPSLSHPFYAEVAEGVLSAAQGRGYGVFLRLTEEDPPTEWEALENLAAKQVDGILLCGSPLEEEKITRFSDEHGIPFLLLTDRPTKNLLSVYVSGAEGLGEVTAHLLRLGHEAVGYVGWRSPNEDTRVEGVRRALESKALKLEERRTVYAPNLSVEAGREATLRLFLRSLEVTAVVAYDDHLAVGAMQACADLEKNVPGQVAVAGFGDLPLASLVAPTLTTMRVPHRETGEWMMEQLAKALASEPLTAERIRMKPKLVMRESCGKGNAAKEIQPEGDPGVPNGSISKKTIEKEIT